MHIILEDVKCQLQSIVPSAPGLRSVLTWVTACMCDYVLEQALLLAGCSQGPPLCAWGQPGLLSLQLNNKMLTVGFGKEGPQF